MKIIYFKAYLKSKAIFSERAISTGPADCLPYIPGSAFLGLVASKLYNRFPDSTFDIFHNGKIRFGSAYPVTTGGLPTIPIPLSWHVEKGEKCHKDGILERNSIYNCLRLEKNIEDTSERQGIQLKSIREGFFSWDGTYIRPDTTYDLKTATDLSKHGRSKEEQLYGYESLDPGDFWYFSVEFDDIITDEISEAIATELTTGTKRMGKSRSSEYGGNLIIERVKQLELPCEPDKKAPIDAIHYYCLTDIALRNNETGAPTLIPEPVHFHLDDTAKFDPERSYIRSRTYTSFNKKRQLYDLEKQAICRGSLITFHCSGKVLTDDYLRIIQDGIGCYRNEGLGKVFVNPSFLLKEYFEPIEMIRPLVNDSMGALEQTVSDPLIHWINEKAEEDRIEERAITMVEGWLPILANTIKIMGKKAPSKSQWSQLRHIAMKSQTPASLHEMLFGDRGLCSHGVSKDQWNEKEFSRNGHWMTFSQFIQQEIIESLSADFTCVRKCLFILGNRLPHRLNQEG